MNAQVVKEDVRLLASHLKLQGIQERFEIWLADGLFPHDHIHDFSFQIDRSNNRNRLKADFRLIDN